MPLGFSTTTRLDAIVVPASRRAARLRHVIELAAECQTLVVVLASHQCDVREVAALIAATPRSRALIVNVPLVHDHEALSLGTSAPEFRLLSAGRSSNLSLKRNIGLLLARLRGWRKIMFLDDDILPLTPDDVRRVAHHLETRRFAGLRTIAKPDNSVVCHANRLVGAEQGIFVSGAALGVNCADVPLDVFPDIYNEDWFAFAGEASTMGVGNAGDARQLEFNPFADPRRAACEEFGDVLAEGLYALFNDGGHRAQATRAFWARFIASRAELITTIDATLKRQVETHESVQAQASLARSLEQLAMIHPEDCVHFLDVWQQDQNRFAAASAKLSGGTPYRDAFAYLGLPDWQLAEFGNALVPTRYLPSYH
jgi:hypothetical protein